MRRAGLCRQRRGTTISVYRFEIDPKRTLATARLGAAEPQSRLVQNGTHANQCVHGLASQLYCVCYRMESKQTRVCGSVANCIAFATVWSASKCVYGMASQLHCVCYGIERMPMRV